MGQGNTKGPDPLSSDQPARVFPGDLTTEEQKQMVIRAYNNLKTTFETFARPDGGKEAPAKTCRDLHVAHPEKPTGDVSLAKIVIQKILQRLQIIIIFVSFSTGWIPMLAIPRMPSWSTVT
jgi:hypothetical protein